MTNYKKRLVIGTRSSGLALAQTRIFVDKLLHNYSDMSPESIEIRQIKTSGDQNQSIRLDQMGGKGLFAKEIETELLKGTIDLAIHSMKDMPAVEHNELAIGCWLERYDHRDALLCNDSIKSISHLSKNSLIGTSSIRRRSQILNLRKDISIKSLRGNVDTRIKKLTEKEFDAIILSVAGLKRLSLKHLISFIFSENEMLPASCQGAIGIQIKLDNEDLKSFLSPLNHQLTEDLCTIERNVLMGIKANCNSPIGILATNENNRMKLQCDIFNHDGNKIYANTLFDMYSQTSEIGKKMAEDILSNLGQQQIDNLDFLKNDFDYTPS